MNKFKVISWWNSKLYVDTVWEVSPDNHNLFVKVGNKRTTQKLTDKQIQFLQDKGFVEKLNQEEMNNETSCERSGIQPER